MINKLEIKNFQSHEDSILEFVPGVNVIVGSSDSGKSAIIRALRWVTWNRPAGDEMKSHWGGETKVTIITEEQNKILRQRGKENLYKLNDTSFSAFGNEVPEEIKDSLQLNENNLQQQLDAPFLLSKSPGEVALHFNKIAHLEKIHEGQKNVEKWLRQIQSDVESKEIQLSEKETELTNYQYLDKLEMDIEVLEGMQDRVDTLYKSKAKLNETANNIREAEREIKEQSKILQAESKVNEILDNITLSKQQKETHKELMELRADIFTVNDLLETNQEMIADESKVNDLLQLYKDKEKLRTEGNSLYALKKSINSVVDELAGKKRTLRKNQTEFEKQFPDICPLCNTNLK